MISLAPHVRMTETDEGVVLLDERSGRYWQMNGTGAAALNHMLADGNAEAAEDALRARHPQAAARIAEDVRELLAALRAANLVQTS